MLSDEGFFIGMASSGGRGTNIRQRRVADLIARELSLILQREARDPRLAGAVITGVRVSGDLRQARVYVANIEPEDRKELMQALDYSSSFLRRTLAAKVTLKFIPELLFEIDETYDKAQRIESLLDQIANDTDDDEAADN